jgi:hypothetical protein
MSSHILLHPFNIALADHKNDWLNSMTVSGHSPDFEDSAGNTFEGLDRLSAMSAHFLHRPSNTALPTIKNDRPNAVTASQNT